MGDDEAKKEDANMSDSMSADGDDAADDDDKSSSKKRKAPPPPAARTGKRERKAASSFVPVESFKAKGDARVATTQGRGKPLLELEHVHESIASASSVELNSAFKLLFSARGKFTTLAMKSHLLEFNGYLPEIGDDVPEDKRNKMEEDAEAKASRKAYKLKLQEIKMLCDFFKLDRSGITTKEDCIDRLLDFLGINNEEFLKSNSKKGGGANSTAAKSKASKKKKKKAPAKTKKKEVEEEESEDEEEEEEDEKENNDDDDTPLSKQPTDKALRRWVKAYIACFNMDKATIKHALETASDKFGVDLSEKKQKIKQMLTEEM